MNRLPRAMRSRSLLGLALPLLSLLTGCGPTAEDIAKAIQSENPVMREDGAKIAQNYDDDVVVDALITVLADPSQRAKLNALESLSELQNERACPALIERLTGDSDPLVRRAAADGIGRVLCKDGAPALITYAQEFAPDDRAQLGAIWGIGRLGYEGLEPDIRKQALDLLIARREQATDPYVKYNVNLALRYLK